MTEFSHGQRVAIGEEFGVVITRDPVPEGQVRVFTPKDGLVVYDAAQVTVLSHQFWFDREADFITRSGGTAAEATRVRAAGSIREGMRVRIAKVPVAGVGPSDHIGREGVVRRIVPHYCLIYVDLDEQGRKSARRNECFGARAVEMVEATADA